MKKEKKILRDTYTHILYSIHHCDDHVRRRRASVVLIASCTAAAAVEAGEKDRRRRKAKENAERRDDRIYIYITIYTPWTPRVRLAVEGVRRMVERG